ncbi:MAG TPA: 30S ribosomal protein S5 [Candidatus Woesearchaeota archaeon]|nr:30S ribosomal protein S5 [Candidatus Woesearchaeota archaeon]
MLNKKTNRNNNRRPRKSPNEPVFDKEAWKPKTSIGKKVKSGEISKIDELLDNGIKILEPEIVDALLPNLKTELLLIGQSKGKFGGGQRRVFRQTQKKTKEGNKPKFATYAVVGNNNGYVGIGYGKSKETVPAREKAIRNAKLNIIKIKRGCGSWQCSCGKPHSIPFNVEAKCGSSIIKIMPAPKGKGLCIEKECQKILNMAGIKDVWSKTKGQTKVKTNLVAACFDALKQLSSTRVQQRYYKSLNIVEGAIEKQEPEPEEDTMINSVKKKVKEAAKPKKDAPKEETMMEIIKKKVEKQKAKEAAKPKKDAPKKEDNEKKTMIKKKEEK